MNEEKMGQAHFSQVSADFHLPVEKNVPVPFLE